MRDYIPLTEFAHTQDNHLISFFKVFSLVIKSSFAQKSYATMTTTHIINSFQTLPYPITMDFSQTGIRKPTVFKLPWDTRSQGGVRGRTNIWGQSSGLGKKTDTQIPTFHKGRQTLQQSTEDLWACEGHVSKSSVFRAKSSPQVSVFTKVMFKFKKCQNHLQVSNRIPNSKQALDQLGPVTENINLKAFCFQI